MMMKMIMMMMMMMMMMMIKMDKASQWRFALLEQSLTKVTTEMHHCDM